MDCRESVFPISASVTIFTSNASTSFPKIARSGSRCHSFGTGAVNNCDFSHYYCTYIMSLFLVRSCHVLSSARGIIITSRSEQIQMRRFGLFCPKQKHEKHKTHGAWHGFARLIRTLNSLFSSLKNKTLSHAHARSFVQEVSRTNDTFHRIASKVTPHFLHRTKNIKHNRTRCSMIKTLVEY